MEKNRITGLFLRALDRSKGSKFRRFRKAPLHVLKSLFLEFVASRLNIPISMNVKTFWGDELNVVLPEYVAVCLERYSFFEETVTLTIIKNLKPGMTFFDIGAHVGYFSALSAVLVGPQGQVHSFEPTKSTFRILERNLSRHDHIHINNLAVSDRKTVLTINDFGPRYSSYNSIATPRLSQEQTSRIKFSKYSVETTSLDDYVDEFGAIPNIIKIDAENAELAILKGGVRTLEKHHPLICLEPGDSTEAGIIKTGAIISMLWPWGFRPYIYRNKRLEMLRDEKITGDTESLFFFVE